MADEPVSSVEAARGQRQGVRAAMQALERALSAPTPGRADEWLAEVGATVDALEGALEQHIEVTEGDRGLFAEVMATAPRLSHRVDRLRAEHVALRTEVTELRARTSRSGGGEGMVAEVRDAGVALLGHLVHHRHLGADTVYEAFNVDIEGGD